MPLAERLGGAEIMLERLLERTSANGINASVVFFESGPLCDAAVSLGLAVQIVRTGRLREPLRGLRAIGALARLIRRERPDVVLSWMAKAHLYAGPAAALAGRSETLAWWQHAHPARSPIDRAVAQLPWKAIGCSSLSVAEEQRAATPGDVFTVHPGIAERSQAGLDAAEIASLRAAWNVPPGRPVVAIIGRLQPWKNQHVVIESLAKLQKTGCDAHLLVVGGDSYGLSPDYRQLLERRVSELQLADRVTLTGHVERVEDVLACTDVLVNASVREPFGLVILEAMRAGVSVVAVDGGGPAEILTDGVNGRLITTPKPEVLVPVLRNLLEDVDRRRMLATAAIHDVQNLFSADAMARSLNRELGLRFA